MLIALVNSRGPARVLPLDGVFGAFEGRAYTSCSSCRRRLTMEDPDTSLPSFRQSPCVCGLSCIRVKLLNMNFADSPSTHSGEWRNMLGRYLGKGWRADHGGDL